MVKLKFNACYVNNYRVHNLLLCTPWLGTDKKGSFGQVVVIYTYCILVHNFYRQTIIVTSTVKQ